MCIRAPPSSDGPADSEVLRRTGCGAARNAAFFLSSSSADSIACRKPANRGRARRRILLHSRGPAVRHAAARRGVDDRGKRRGRAGAAEREVRARRERLDAGRIGGRDDALVVHADETDVAAIATERAIGAAKREHRRLRGRSWNRGRLCRNRGRDPERTELIVAASIQRPVGRAHERAVATGRHLCDPDAGWQRHPRRNRAVRRRAITQLRFGVVAPRPHAAVRAGDHAVPRAGRKRDDVGHIGYESKAIDHLAAAQLPVASTPERVQLLVSGEDERVKEACPNISNVAGELRDRHLGEVHDPSAANRALPHPVVARAIEIAIARHGDAETVAGGNLCDRLTRERFHEYGPFTLVVGGTRAQRALGVHAPPIQLPVRRHHQRVIGGGRDRLRVAHHDGRVAIAVASRRSTELTVDVLSPGENLAIGAQCHRVTIAEDDRGVSALRGRIRSRDDEGELAG
jgi:hypothetical protein